GATGVNWNVKIMALKADGPAKEGISLQDLLAAYNYVSMMRDRGVDIRVTNNSYGGFQPFSKAWKEAIDIMGERGILFVPSAPNQATDIDNTGDDRMYPAAFDSANIISVAATDHNDRYMWFTNYGSVSVDLAAPGVAVFSTIPGGGYGWANGTSMAAPY